MPVAEAPAHAGRDLARIEHALTTLIRRARLPRVHDSLTASAGVTVDRALYAVLVRLDERDPVRLTELADVLAVDVSTLSRQAKALESEGLIARSPDPADGRAALISLTASGRRVLARLREARQTAIAAVLTEWDATDQADFARLLERFLGSFDRLAEHTGGS